MNKRSVFPFAGLLLAALATHLPTLKAQDLRALNSELVLQSQEEQAASRATAAAIHTRLSAAIERRAVAMRELIAKDPAAALSMALPPEIVADLQARYPHSAGSLEVYGTWEGPVTRWIADSEDGSSRQITLLKADNQNLEVYSPHAEAKDCGGASSLSVTGIRLGNRVAASKREVSSLATTAGATTSCGATGVQNTIVLMVTFPGVTPPSTITPQSIYDIFFGTAGHSLDGYWKEASSGQTAAAGSVYGWYTLSQAYTCSTLDQAVAEAIQIASGAGATFPNGSRVFLIYPKIGCVAGFAQVGCSTLGTPSGVINASLAYIEADYMTGDQGVYFAVHEAGHNLGLQHAGTLINGNETLGPLTSPGTVNEYGDNFSAMGSQTLGQYSAQHKAETLGWMNNGSNYQVVQSSGTWTLQPYGATASGLQAIKVQRGSGNDAWLWIEYRLPAGTYDSTLYFQQPSGGAFIHYQDPSVGAYTHLLNFQPQTASWYAPALLPGQTWVDPYSNVSISVQSATATALTVNVMYGPSNCTRAVPAITLSPSISSASPGDTVAYTLTLTNNDSSGCDAATFNLSSSQPAGWPTSFSAAGLTLSPGKSGSLSMTKTVPAGSVIGSYSVDAVAAAGSFVATGSAEVTVVAPALTVSVATPGSTYTAGQTVSISALATYRGVSASGAAVTFTLTQPNGSKITKTIQASSSGSAIWNYKIGPKGARGIYSVTATAIYSSQAATSAPATFTVQ